MVGVNREEDLNEQEREQVRRDYLAKVRERVSRLSDRRYRRYVPGGMRKHGEAKRIPKPERFVP